MTQSSSIPVEQYAFPNISFTESVVGPLPFTPKWRNTIGVAGVFSKGPSGPTFIKNRQEFAYFFGEDDSPGSIFVRQAMLQGGTNFYLSRVMPSPAKSFGKIYLQAASNPTSNEAFVGTTSRTIGLTFEASYIGSPIIESGEYIGSQVRIAEDSPLTIPNFIGIGYFDFKVIEKVISNVPPTGTIVSTITNTTSVLDVQILKASGASGTTLLLNAKPGRVLKTTSEGVSFSHPNNNGLRVLSYPYLDSTGTYAVLVQGLVSGVVSNTTTVTLESSDVSSPDYFVLSYTYRTGDNSFLPEETLAPKNYANIGIADGFLTVKSTDRNYQPVPILLTNNTKIVSLDTGIEIALGTATDTVIELLPTAKFSVPFMRGEVSVGETDVTSVGFPNTGRAFNSGLAAAEILNSLKQEIDGDFILSSMIDNLTINNNLLPYDLSFYSSFEGQEANRIIYKLSRTVSQGNPTDLVFDAYDFYVAMEEGKDGMKNARLYLYDINGNPLIYIEAINPGKSGNSIRLSVSPSPPGQFRLEVIDDTASKYNVSVSSESYVLSNYSVDPKTGVYQETLDSKMIRVYFVPVALSVGNAIARSTYDLTPQRKAPPIPSLQNTTFYSNPSHPSHRGSSYLKDIYLKEGYEPSDYSSVPPEESDYLEAVRRLEEVDCAFIALAGVSVSDARYETAVTELMVQAERSSTLNGLRIAVISAPPRLTESRASTIASGLSSKRVVIVGGYTTMVGARYLGVNSVPSLGYYCGTLASISPHISPASVASGRSVTGVLSTDTKNTPTYLDALTRGRCELLYYDPGLQQYKFLNGLTTSNDPYEKYVSIRRLTDQIIMDLYRNLQWVRSQPNNSSLRSRVSASCDAYLRSLVRDEMLYNFSPTVCDESNNTIQDMSSGRLNLRITYTPVYPADFMRVSMIRDLTTELTVASNPS